MTHFAAVLDAERIKLTTLSSPLWATAAAALLSFAVAALQAAASYRGLTVTSAALGVARI